MEIIDPLKLYMPNGNVWPITPGFLTAAIANNQVVVAAVSGYRIRVMGFDLQSTGAPQGTVLFKSSGGANLRTVIVAPPSTANPFIMPVINSGYFETVTGEALVVDVTTATVYVNVSYIIYKP